jgi:hypothetical protein
MRIGHSVPPTFGHSERILSEAQRRRRGSASEDEGKSRRACPEPSRRAQQPWWEQAPFWNCRECQGACSLDSGILVN